VQAQAAATSSSLSTVVLQQHSPSGPYALGCGGFVGEVGAESNSWIEYFSEGFLSPDFSSSVDASLSISTAPRCWGCVGAGVGAVTDERRDLCSSVKELSHVT